MREVQNRQIKQYFEDKGFTTKDDLIITEHALDLIVNDAHHTTYYCTPSLLEELVIGNLAINGVINKFSDLEFVDVKDDCIKVIVKENKSEKTQVQAADDFVISAKDALKLMNQHLDSSPLHKTTGGTHIMSLATVDEILFSCQDIGRHNALDKLYGICLKNDIDISDKILLSSGRMTHEMCYKAVQIGVKIILSRAAVSSLAIDLAEEFGLTIAGFTRVNRFNVYSNPQRIIE
ncbi:MAG: formate dehydrogenase accessory sulfurtransferase FdhD [Syntrophomonadaceae bacterium]|nr:formate dehydrogenase accessory sulfurtransferase FdhD [Syntrophomonadaceae bacterium]